MTDKKISELPAVVTTSLNDEIPIVQSGTTKKASLATILSSLGTTGYYLDSVPAAAIFNAPGGYFSLNGSTVSLSSLLSFSSAAKYTVGPDGNYILNSVNSPAWDWSTGRRRLLIEANGSTNLTSSPEDTHANWTALRTTGSLITNGFGAVNSVTLTSLVNYSDSTSFGALSVGGGGGVCSLTIALKQGSAPVTTMGIYDNDAASFGSPSTVTAKVLYGPGAVSVGSDGVVTPSGLSTSQFTLMRVTRTFAGTATAYGLMYTNWTAVGQTLSYAAPQFESGYGSSYIPNNTPRPPDIVTASSELLALLTAANASLAARGVILISSGALDVLGSSSASGALAVIDGSGVGALIDTVGMHVLATAAPASFVGKAFGLGASWAGAKRKLASGGTAVVSDNYTMFSGDTGIRFFNGPDGPGNGYLDELVVWPILASDAGLQAQARVYS